MDTTIDERYCNLPLDARHLCISNHCERFGVDIMLCPAAVMDCSMYRMYIWSEIVGADSTLRPSALKNSHQNTVKRILLQKNLQSTEPVQNRPQCRICLDRFIQATSVILSLTAPNIPDEQGIEAKDTSHSAQSLGFPFDSEVPQLLKLLQYISVRDMLHSRYTPSCAPRTTKV
jgi:hypothetical protein